MAGKPGCRIGNTRVNNHYENGVMTSLNGYKGTGLLCNKGERLYDTSVINPIFDVPKDTTPEEYFESLSQEAAPGVMDYYAISNYGRLINRFTCNIMKENVRPNGYGYYCLASEKGQTKYTSHIMIAKTFVKKENESQTQVNHINGNKLDNYVNKRMEDGSIQSNLEWTTPKENVNKAYEIGLKKKGVSCNVLTENDVKDICKRLENKESVANIHKSSYSNISYGTIALIKHRRTWINISKDYSF